MRIAITGSSGLIGTALLRSLRADGHEPVPVVRHRPAEGEVGWDPDGGEMDASGLEGLDGAVHLAGAGIADRRWSEQRKRIILESRTRGTALLAGTLAGLQNPPPVLVSGSAMGFYGERGDEVLEEGSDPGDGFLAGVVQAWEKAAAPAEEVGITVAYIRTGLVLDAAGGALAKMLPLFRLGLGGRLGSGRQWWSWITLADEVRAIRLLLEAPLGGPVNLTAPGATTNAEFTRVLAGVLHRPAVVAVPRAGPRLLLGRELADELLFTSSRVRPRALEGAGFAFTHADLATALPAVLDRPAPTRENR